MHYDERGHWLGADLITDSTAIGRLAERLRDAAEHTVGLNTFLAGHRD